jgi:CHAT domain-containing protein
MSPLRLVLVVLAGLGALAGCGRPAGDERQQAVAEIRRLRGDVRPIEARLSFDTGWAPCDPRCSPPPPPTDPDLPRLRALSRQGRRNPGLATLALFLATDEATTKAVFTILETAGPQPEALADLAAVSLHLAGLTGRPELLLDSLEASTEALALRPRYLPALFNRALALSRLHLDGTAHHAWENYLAAAPKDGWAAEARELRDRTAADSYQQRWRSNIEPGLRHAALAGDTRRVRALVAQHRQRSREWAERELLPAWAEGGLHAGQALVIAGRIGDALAGLSGDRMLADGVKIISASTGPANARLRAGHRELAAGLDALYVDWQLGQARERFQQARGHLAGSPYALWADLYLALVSYYQNDHDQAREALEALDGRVDSHPYPALAGRVRWIAGLNAAVTYDLETADESYGKSLQAFRAGGEEENLATMHAMLAEVLSKAGSFDESWTHLASALARSDRIYDPIRLHAVLETAVFNARRQHFDRAGLAFAEEHLLVARRTGGPQILHYAFMHLAGLRYALGDLAGAKADLAEAARSVAEVKDPSLRQRSAADFDLVNAEIEAAEDPRLALPRLTRTIEQYESTQYDYLLPQAYGARARAFRRLGNLAAAEKDLANQIRIYGDSADETQQDVFRLSLLDQAAPAFDEMIELQAVRLGRPARALGYSESSRHRAFLSARNRAPMKRATRHGPEPWADFDPQRLRAGLPSDTAVLELALLDDHLLAWVVTRSGLQMTTTNVKRTDLVRQIRKMLRGLDGESPRGAGRDLYDLLIRPAAPALRGITHLVVVPDKELYRIPFEALVDRQSGRFLLEDLTVSYAPSAALYLHLRDKAARLHQKPPQRIVAATGAQDGGFRYARLPQAPAEAAAIAALYPSGSFLANPGKESFLDVLSRSQILHFSGHAVPNPEQPFASRLVLADTPSTAVDLYAYELYDRELPDLELVVLSACSTAKTARLRPGLGIAATLAGPFLAAGVPRVIGSQWPVSDKPTRLFFTAFHRRFTQGADAATALRATKLEFLHSGNPDLASPRTWAAFVLVGG